MAGTFDRADVVGTLERLQDRICRDARGRWLEARADARRFQNLVYLLTAAAVAFLVLTIFWLLIEKTVAQALASGVGTIVTGAGAGFALTRRNEERAREIARYKDYKADCPRVVEDEAIVAGDPRYAGGNEVPSRGGGFGRGNTAPD